MSFRLNTLKIVLAAAAFVAASFAAFPQGQAEMRSANETSLAPSARVDAKARFRPAAYVRVEHEPFILSNIIPFMDETMTVTKQAFVSVRGLPGETVTMTCSVENGAKVQNRDCAGYKTTEPKIIMAGHTVDNSILLTNDLLPDTSGESDSSISIEVTYI